MIKRRTTSGSSGESGYSLSPASLTLLAGTTTVWAGCLRNAQAVAVAAARPALLTRLRGCLSGRELIERGFESDVQIIAELDADACVPGTDHDAAATR